MQYLYHENANEQKITISGENHKYLFKVRRFEVGKIIDLRNLVDDTLYSYKIEDIGKKEATLDLVEAKKDLNTKSKSVHLLWCIIDPKVIYTTLPMLNQIGVEKITFLYCQRSQKSFKIDLNRAKRILINSSQQCGRVTLMDLEILDGLKSAIESYDEFDVMDFGGDLEWGEVSRVLIGCEGGFSSDEKKILKKHRKIGLKTSNIVKSETATLIFSTKTLI
jgi:16S rRNA (uracil1498-N3)-methyltransferase